MLFTVEPFLSSHTTQHTYACCVSPVSVKYRYGSMAARAWPPSYRTVRVRSTLIPPDDLFCAAGESET